jgi:hypothetical protein
MAKLGRRTVDVFVATVAMLLSMMLDVSLFSLFKAHLQRSPVVSRYRPLYTRSGRRNRAWY